MTKKYAYLKQVLQLQLACWSVKLTVARCNLLAATPNGDSQNHSSHS